jgi:dephospho-CoA kinase
LSRPLHIGLTGGIGTGKSTVSGLFAALGVPVIDTDQIARELVAPGTALLTRVISQTGAPCASGSLHKPRTAPRWRL